MENRNEKALYRFAENGNCCEILAPEPPRHWYNYLWNEDRYCSQISQMGHGKSYYLDEKANMCMINRDDAKYVFLRDEEDGSFWNIGQGPLNVPVEEYCCRHHIAYSEISSAKKGIRGSLRIFVPRAGHHEIWTITLKNTDTRERKLSTFSTVSFSMEGFSYPRYYEMYRCAKTEIHREWNGIYCNTAHPFAPHDRYQGFLASTKEVYAYEGNLAEFCGTDSTLTLPDASAGALFQHPRTVVSGEDCTNSEAALFILGGVLQHRVVLKPGEEKELHVIFGTAADAEEVQSIVEKYSVQGAVEEALKEASEAYFEKYASLSVSTPEEKINAIMNNWVKKQVDFCIVGKKGVRDNLQIAVGLLQYRQEKAREEILECLRHQFKDGHGVLTWYPYDATRYSDQPFWIIWAVCELIKETGDFSVLTEVIEWQDDGAAAVKEHVDAAIRRLLNDRGANGLVKIYFADWNDALNITDDPEAESVMLSHQFCLALKEWADCLKYWGNTAEAERISGYYQEMKEAINQKAWDGSWYVRALSKKGNVGSKDSKGSKIYINAQTWGVLAEVPDQERLKRVLEAVDGMEHDFGYPLNLPPYPEYDPHVGRMSGMYPGLFENGGVYCHATGFKVLMDCKVKRADKALHTLKKIMPDNECNPSSQSGAEPYVFTNCYSTNPGYYGKSYQSWTTGTSSWCLMGLYEGILGIKRGYDGLVIDPSFPSGWKEAAARRWFRGSEYRIIYKNPHGKENGAMTIRVDGRCLSGSLIPDFRDGKSHEIEVIFE